MLVLYTSPPIWKIHPHDNTVLSTSNLQAYLPQWPPFSQHTLVAVMQQSGDSVFYNRDTSFLTQSPIAEFSILLVSHY